MEGKITFNAQGLKLKIYDLKGNFLSFKEYNYVYSELTYGDLVLNLNKKWIVDVNELEVPVYVVVFDTSASEYEFDFISD